MNVRRRAKGPSTGRGARSFSWGSFSWRSFSWGRLSSGSLSVLRLRLLAAVAVAACSSVACPAEAPRHEGAATSAPAMVDARQVPSLAGGLPGAGGTPQSAPAAAAVKATATKVRKVPPAPTRAPEDAAPVDLVTIHVLVDPPQRAHVIWGVKDFGLGPVDIRRPRGSGPLDLLVRAPGYLTLHTRAFTDRDNTLSVHLVPEAEAPRFAGYRAPAPTVTAHAAPLAASRRTTARAMRPGKPAVTAAPPAGAPSDGAGAP